MKLRDISERKSIILVLIKGGWMEQGRSGVGREKGRGNSNPRMGFFNNCPGMKKLQVSKAFFTLLTPESQREPFSVDTMKYESVLINI